MPNWDEIKRMFQQAQTPQEKNEAVRALSETVKPEKTGSVITGNMHGTNVVSLGDLQGAMQDESIYERVKKTITGG